MPALKKRRLTGSCLCGAVQYSVEDAFTYALNCHCSQCRRATGSAFKPLAGIERRKLKVTRGARTLLKYGSDVDHDVRCRKCGSLLYSVVRDGAWVHVALGSLMDAPTLRPTAHIYMDSKASWHTITDALPQHLGLPR